MMREVVFASFLALGACDGYQSDQGANEEASLGQTSSGDIIERTEAALLDQIKCEEPPQAGVAMTAMLRNRLIHETQDGGDGIELFVPTQRLELLGFEVVRLGGWQAGVDGGAMPPFSRGPGTAPPNHIAITVRASVAQVQRELTRLEIDEGHYVPDETQEPWTDSSGVTRQPQRQVPGPTVRDGDYDDGGYVQQPLSGVATIECSANEYDFERAAKAHP